MFEGSWQHTLLLPLQQLIDPVPALTLLSISTLGEGGAVMTLQQAGSGVPVLLSDERLALPLLHAPTRCSMGGKVLNSQTTCSGDLVTLNAQAQRSQMLR